MAVSRDVGREGPKKEQHDSRQVFLTIEGPGFSSVAALPPRDEVHARSFAAALEAAARVTEQAARERVEAVGAARAELERSRLDRSEVLQAEKNLRAVEEAASRLIANAERELADAEDDGAVRSARERLVQLEGDR